MTYIGDLTFLSDSLLTSVTIPSTVTSIGYNPFTFCTSLTTITFVNNDNFFYDLDGTSLCYFELIEDIKSKFGINLLAEKSRAFYSVNDIYEFVKEKTEKKNRVKS